MHHFASDFDAARADFDDGIAFLDDECVELVEEPVADSASTLDTAITRVWIRPYAAR